MPALSILPARPLLSLGLAALLLGSACSSGDSPAPPASAARAFSQRLELRLAEPRELPEFEVVRKLTPPADWVREESSGGWEVDVQVPNAGVVAVGQAPDGSKVQALIVRGKTEKSVSIHGEFDPREFNVVVLKLVGSKDQSVQLRCFRGGKPLANSEVFQVPEGPDNHPVAITFELPGLHRIDAPFDELRLRFQQPEGVLALYALDLLRQPFERFLPLPEDGPQLAEIGASLRELRAGVGLSSRAPLLADFDVPPGAELAFTYGVPEQLRTPAARPRLVLELSNEAGTRLTREYELEPKLMQREKARWFNETLELEQLAGSRVRLSARLVCADGYQREALCFLAEMRVRVRGPEAPSVLLVTSDTHRADHMGLSKPTGADQPRVQTPALDELGRRGVYYTNCYSATNVTNPSHIALMTATHVRDTRIVNNHSPLVPDATTLAERFHDAGYRTFASVSASHLVHEESGLGQGFERMSAPRRADRDAVETIDKLLAWLSQVEGEPVFVWLHLFDAHAPYGPPEGFDRRYYGDKNPRDKSAKLDIPNVEVPPFLAGVTDSDFPYEQYRAEVDYLDSQLARVLALPRIREGIVGFTADHGESFGEHGIWWDHAELYPTTVHIPLILSWPGAPAETRVDAPVQQIDLGRTLLDLAGLEQVAFPGRDLRWPLEDDQATQPRYLISAHGSSAAIQSGSWHLILNLTEHSSWALEQRRMAHSVELYNLKEDPECLHDVLEQEFERAARMRKDLLEWLSRAPTQGLGSSGGQRTTSADAALQALGYLEGGESDVAPSSAWYTPDPKNPWDQRFENY